MTPSLYIHFSSTKGVSTLKTTYKPDAWLYFRCKNNGTLVGTSFRKCNGSSGLWSGTTPVCIGRS
jgi:hypothetical protein